MAAPALDTLPANAQCEFVGEGSANIVFRILTPSEPYTGQLLRVPKSNTDAFSYQVQQDFFQDRIRPLLKDENIVSQTLVRVPEQLAAHLNSLLAALDSSTRAARRQDWLGTRVAHTSEGMLVTDMSGASSSGQEEVVVVVQFKPKWLAQSPSAPEGSRRCRTCAREAERRHGAGGGRAAAGGRYFCPLDLVAASRGGSDEAAAAVAAAERVWAACADPLIEKKGDDERVRARFLGWLRATDLFSRLARLQADEDRRGALVVQQDGQATAAAADLAGLQTAMTLRDCSCYVVIPLDDDQQPVQARLGDLDKKNGPKKLVHWRAIETALIDGGFYTETERPRQELPCRLACGI